jgi:hypothetical protein
MGGLYDDLDKRIQQAQQEAQIKKAQLEQEQAKKQADAAKRKAEDQKHDVL